MGQRYGKAHAFTKGNKLGGRKPTTVELGSRQKILDIIGPNGFTQIVQRMFAQARKGSFRHQELLCHYILGKPTDRIKIEGDGSPMMQYNPVVKIIADTLRLEKLEKDTRTDGVIKEDTIKEVEQVLTDAVQTPMVIVKDDEDLIGASKNVKSNGKATRKVKRRKK